MLALHDTLCSWFLRAFAYCSIAVLTNSGINAENFVRQLNFDPAHSARLFITYVEQETAINTIIDRLFDFRNALVSGGCEIPLLSDVLTHSRYLAWQEGFEIDDAEFEALYAKFKALEGSSYMCNVETTRHKSKGKDKRDKTEVKLNSKTAIGFLKFVGGTLLLIIPCPPMQAMGGSLVVLGINDMVESSRHKENKRGLEELHPLVPLD